MTAIEQIAVNARRAGMRIGVAESLTSGTLAAHVGAGEDAGTWFAGGIVAYQLSVKQRVLGVAPGVDPCSAACAEQLATGARDLLGADAVVSTTGVGGPDPQDGHPPGTVFVGWATADGCGHARFAFDGGPEEVMSATVDAALDVMVRLTGAARSTLG